jgi:hypothetical protein
LISGIFGFPNSGHLQFSCTNDTTHSVKTTNQKQFMGNLAGGPIQNTT